MAVRCEIQEFLVSSGDAVSTTYSRTWQFTPQAILVLFSGQGSLTDSVSGARPNYGVGMAVSASSRVCYSGQNEDGSGTGDTDRSNTRDMVVRELSIAGAQTGALDISSWSGTNITFIIDDQFAANMRITVIAFGGFSNVGLVHFNDRNTGTAGDHDVTITSFGNVDAVLCAGIMLATSPAVITSQQSLSFGFGSWNGSAWEQAVLAGRDESGDTIMNSFSYCRSGQILGTLDLTGATLLVRASLSSRITDGVRLNYAECDAPTTGRINSMLFFQGGTHKVGSITTQTDTSTAMGPSGLSFRPAGGILISHCKTESADDTPQDHEELSIGAFDEFGAEACQYMASQDNVADCNTTIGASAVGPYLNASVSASTKEGEMGGVTIANDGWSAVMADADPSGNFVPYWTFGDAVASGGIRIKYNHYRKLQSV